MKIGYQNIELTSNISSIESFFRELGDSVTEENPIQAVFKGFKSAKKIDDFITKQQNSEVFGTIPEAGTNSTEFQAFFEGLRDYLYIKSLGKIDFSKDEFSNVIENTTNSKRLLEAVERLKNNVLAAIWLLKPTFLIKKVYDTLGNMLLTIQEKYKKEIDLTDDTEYKLVTSEQRMPSSFEQKQMNVFLSTVGNASSAKSNLFANSGKPVRPKEISLEYWNEKVLAPMAEIERYREIITKTLSMIEVTDGLGFEKDPEEKLDTTNLVKNLAWLRNSHLYKSRKRKDDTEEKEESVKKEGKIE